MAAGIKKRVTFADQPQTENVTPKAPMKEPRQYEVEKILGKRELKKGEIDYKLSWKGYSSEFDIWVPEENLDCPDLLEAFENQLLLNPSAIKKKRGRPSTRSNQNEDGAEVPSKRIRTLTLKSSSKATGGNKETTPTIHRMKTRTSSPLVQSIGQNQTHERPIQPPIPQNETISETRRTRSRTNTMAQRTPIQTPKMNNQPLIVEVEEAIANIRITRSLSIIRSETRTAETPNLLSSAVGKDTPETRGISSRTPSTMVNRARAQPREAPIQVAGGKATPKTPATKNRITPIVEKSVRAEIPETLIQPVIVPQIHRKRTRTTTLNNNVRNRTREAPNQVAGNKPTSKTGRIGTPSITAIEIIQTPVLPNAPIDIDDEITRFVTRSTRSRPIMILPRAVRTRTSMPQRH